MWACSLFRKNQRHPAAFWARSSFHNSTSLSLFSPLRMPGLPAKDTHWSKYYEYRHVHHLLQTSHLAFFCIVHPPCSFQTANISSCQHQPIASDPRPLPLCPGASPATAVTTRKCDAISRMAPMRYLPRGVPQTTKSVRMGTLSHPIRVSGAKRPGRRVSSVVCYFDIFE